MELELIFRELRPFELSHFLHCRVWNLCNQNLLQFSVNVSQSLRIYCGHIENVHVGFGWS